MASIFGQSKYAGRSYTSDLGLMIETQTATGTAATAQGELTGIDWARNAVVSISGLTSETIGIDYGVVAASIFSAAIKPIDVTTGVAASSAALPNGVYVLNIAAFTSLKFTKSSTSETPTITVRLKN